MNYLDFYATTYQTGDFSWVFKCLSTKIPKDCFYNLMENHKKFLFILVKEPQCDSTTLFDALIFFCLKGYGCLQVDEVVL